MPEDAQTAVAEQMVVMTFRLPLKTKQKLERAVDALNLSNKASLAKATPSDVLRELIDNWLREY